MAVGIRYLMTPVASKSGHRDAIKDFLLQVGLRKCNHLDSSLTCPKCVAETLRVSRETLRISYKTLEIPHETLQISREILRVSRVRHCEFHAILSFTRDTASFMRDTASVMQCTARFT